MSFTITVRRPLATGALALLALPGVLTLSACGGQPPKKQVEAPSYDQGHISVLDLNKAEIRPDTKDDIPYVNKWLREHSDRRIVSLTEVKQLRDSIRSYVIYWKPGYNADQHYQSIWFGSDSDASGQKFAAGLRIWQKAHPDKRIVSLAAMPSPWEGIDTGRLLYENASGKPTK